jgi:dihydrofolate reductase
MRKIAAWLYLSLDGVMEAPETWAFGYSDDEMERENRSGMAASDALLLGRVTYEHLAAYWPHQPSDVPVAKHLNETPKFVVSATLDRVGWQNSTLIRDNVAEELTRLKRQPGKDITVLGSATLVRSLLRDGLLDQLQLMVPPIVVGRGKRLFEDWGDRKAMRLVDSKVFGTGVASLTYQPAGA